MILTLVDAVSFAIVVFTAYVAYVIYDKLPPGCSIPMKFDFDGNIVWSAQGSMWIFLYPAISGAILISFVLVGVSCSVTAALCERCCKMRGFRDEESRQKDLLMHYFGRTTVLAVALMMLGILYYSPQNVEAGTFGPIPSSLVWSFLVFIISNTLFFLYSMAFVVTPNSTEA